MRDQADSKTPFLGAAPALLLAAAAFVLSLAGAVLAAGSPAAALKPAVMVAGALTALIAGGGACLLAARYRGQLDYRARLISHFGETMQWPRALTDSSNRLAWANSSFDRRLRVSPERPVEDLERRLCGDEASRVKFREACDSVRRGEAAEFESKTIAEDGSEELFVIRIFPFAGAAGWMSWQIQDVTAERQMERVVREERAKVVDFLENAPVGFYSVNAAGRFLYANQTLADWLGATADQLVSGELRLQDFLTDPNLHSAALAVAPGLLGPQEGEVKLRSRTGREFSVFISQSVVSDAEGGLRTRTVVRDLTPEREMALALERSEQGFQRFFEEAPVGIALIDSTGRITEANLAFQRMIGLDRTQAIGRMLVELTPAEHRADLADRLARVLEGADGGAGPAEIRLDSSGREINASLFARRLERGGVNPSALILHFIDVTDQKKLEVQFAQSQKMQAVGQLAGGIAHDFNNLLTAMIGFCDLLLLRHQPGDPSFADIMQVKQNANRAANLVRQLLAFSRQQTLQPRVLDVTDALTEISHLLRRLIGENIELQMVHGRDLNLVRVDQGQLEQVIINLAVNARDAMPTGGKLAIRTANVTLTEAEQRGVELMPAGDYILIEVEDAGIGIPKENLTRIFEPFFSTKEVGSGTGLGLSTVYGIVKQTGGFVFVDSAVGKGTTFSIYLPRWKGEKGKTGDLGTDERRRDLTGAGTVLLVEDEDAVRLFSARALRNKGYKVVEAKSGEAALELISAAATNIDLLITDVVMPQMDGTTLIKHVRERRPDMKVICISGYAEEAFRNRLDSAESVHFLPKPFSLDQLAGKVKEVMR